MRRMTEDSLKSAFAGESQAHMRYLIFAEVAEKEGRPNLARLFRAIADAEKVHATNHLNALSLVRDSSSNIQVGIDGENYEIEEMYPAYNAIAELQNEAGAKRSIHYAIEAEKIHSALYQKAKQAVDSGKDVEIRDIYICQVCGHTVEGSAPDRCPICGATRDKFKKF